MDATSRIDDALSERLQRAQRHALYQALDSVEALRLFMSHHVVCVWDFMTLVKSLHRDLVGWSLPWVPPRYPQAARLLNEIILDEESDLIDDEPISHYQLYLRAMDEVGCDDAPMTCFIEALCNGDEPLDAATRAALPPAAQSFLRTSLALLAKPVAARAAVFYYGRELVIPDLFTPLLSQLEAAGITCPSLRVYLQRHVECDGERHGPLARQLVNALCADASAAAKAQTAAERALDARLKLWDAMATQLTRR